ncbi:MAG: protein-disulfide reductase DsbD family protein [Candidatus Kapabacteria bacterium]|nr:protein-disulfide reductase DsbD family protein [Candidatus Kapabacteria bacterium]MDW8011832.1 cytochrome c biogenesis protein CcdA [Bacteroidota bacterium]
MRSPLRLLAIGLVSALCSAAQSNSPVELSVSPPVLRRPAGDTASITVRLQLKPGWYTYSLTPQVNADGIGPEPLRLSVAPASVVELVGRIRAPRPQRKYDEGFQMEVEYYTGSVLFHLPIRITAPQPGRYGAQVVVVYQVCDSIRCLPPEEARLPIELVVEAAAVEAAPSDTSTPPPQATSVLEHRTSAPQTQSPAPPAEQSKVAAPQNIWLLLSIAAGAGAFALLTPCVFPMIPITVSFFTKRAERNRRRAIRDALLYALGIMATFVGLGFLLSLLFGATGIQEFATNPWVNLGIAALFVAFALNLFGAYELMLPPRLLNRLHQASERHGTVGVLLMGLTFSLTSFTCTMPFVGTALVAIAAGEWFYPLLGMTAFSAVFAAPFFLLALFPAAIAGLPRAGAWMNNLKVVMGFLELAAAVKFLSNADLVWGWGIITRELFLASWVICGAFITLYVLGFFRLPHDTPIEQVGPARVIIATLFGTITIWLATGLWDKPLGELEAFLPPRDYHELIGKDPSQLSMPRLAPTSQELEWYDNLETALAEAQRSGRPVFIDFTGFTCTNCRWMETNIFPKPQVRSLLDSMVRVRLFTDRLTEPFISNKRLQQERFGTIELPFYAILTPSGRTIATTGFTRDPDEFASFLRRAFQHRVGSLY